jgi:hypothetical protein
VTAVHLVGDDAKAISHDATDPCGREEAVVATEQVSGRDVGPGSQRPALANISSADSPGAGIIAATSTRSLAGIRSQTIGAM